MAELNLLTLDTLTDMAQTHEIEGRSQMNKDDLAGALQRQGVGLDALTVDQLTEIARDHDISGRSDMTKDDLVAALRDVA